MNNETRATPHKWNNQSGSAVQYTFCPLITLAEYHPDLNSGHAYKVKLESKGKNYVLKPTINTGWGALMEFIAGQLVFKAVDNGSHLVAKGSKKLLAGKLSEYYLSRWEIHQCPSSDGGVEFLDILHWKRVSGKKKSVGPKFATSSWRWKNPE